MRESMACAATMYVFSTSFPRERLARAGVACSGRRRGAFHGWIERIHAPFRRLRQQSLEAGNLGLGGRQIVDVRRVFFGRKLTTSRSGAEYGVTETLRESIRRLTGAVEIQPQASLV